MAIKLSRVIPKKALNAAFLNNTIKNDSGFHKHNHPSTDTTALEAEIVYDSNSNKKMIKLYSSLNNFESVLTEEERKIVEGA